MKEIRMITINKIKTCLLRIFEAEDDSEPDYNIIRANWAAITRLLKPYQFSEEERTELFKIVDWANNNCAKGLEKLGWKILRGKN